MTRITMREAISQALWEEIERDLLCLFWAKKSVCGVAHMPSPKVSIITSAANAPRYTHCGSGIIGAAMGAALVGQRPVAKLMTINFAFSAMDHFVNEERQFHYMFAGQFKLPLVIRTVGGGECQLARRIRRLPTRSSLILPGSKWSRRGRRKMPKDCSSPLSVRMIRFYLSSMPPCIRCVANSRWRFHHPNWQIENSTSRQRRHRHHLFERS